MRGLVLTILVFWAAHSLVWAAPIVVQPGTAAGYTYFPAQINVSGGGGGGGESNPTGVGGVILVKTTGSGYINDYNVFFGSQTCPGGSSGSTGCVTQNFNTGAGFVTMKSSKPATWRLKADNSVIPGCDSTTECKVWVPQGDKAEIKTERHSFTVTKDWLDDFGVHVQNDPDYSIQQGTVSGVFGASTFAVLESTKPASWYGNGSLLPGCASTTQCTVNNIANYSTIQVRRAQVAVERIANNVNLASPTVTDWSCPGGTTCPSLAVPPEGFTLTSGENVAWAGVGGASTQSCGWGTSCTFKVSSYNSPKAQAVTRCSYELIDLRNESVINTVCTADRDVYDNTSNQVVGKFVGFYSYPEDSTKRALIAMVSDATSSVQWGYYGTDTDIPNVTSVPSNLWPTPSVISKIYSVNPTGICVSPWRVPYGAELQKLFDNKTTIGGFSANPYFWSAVESGSNNAWNLYFGNNFWGIGYKFNTAAVRCVRSY